ncbi:hypothetical protein Hypma_010109 [Hypsizygus marmoreus]|uniref:Uncharacterized protein n=1 Tax=Hypsizygus marmoreus TaxID=39966 RepID=A0A369JN74_HYPMA|nr:hypothetical protein Hypma_010109 [Hypsizygus marmoreus]
MDHPLTSSPLAGSLGTSSTPNTPTPAVRSRSTTDKVCFQPYQSPPKSGSHCPKSSPATTFSDPAPAPAIRINDVPRSTFRNVFATSATPSRHVIVRSDPSLPSCFDKADKELYDLWAPKK